MIVAETKEPEKVFTIPLRKAYEKSQRIRSPYAIRLIKDYIQTHTKAGEVRIGKHLNSAIWSRGIKKPPRKVKINIIKDGSTVKAELFGHKYEEFKALPKKEKKGAKEKLLERLGPKAAKKEEEEKMIKGEEKTEEKKEIKDEVKEEKQIDASKEEKVTIKKGKSQHIEQSESSQK